jgi:hypothetical protein
MNDDIRAAAAANRDIANSSAGPHQDCRDVVHIAIFFDGTGNNNDKDTAVKKWSNVGRIFEAAYSEPAKAVYRIYISGVGTPFNGDASWWSTASVWVEDNLGGMGFGAGGDRRMEFGDARVNDRLRDALIINAQKAGAEVAKYAAASEDKSFGELNRALGKHRLIKMINVSIFGFSRGAALARAFSNRLIKSCTQDEHDEDKLKYAGYPITIAFLGLFDTVASFGVPSKNARTPFSERELIVSEKVTRCVHFVAGHEVRFAFPVDLIRKNGKLAGDWLEKTYPGVHSDVGGGYEPTAQGIDNNYARIPMRDMMHEAFVAGVRIEPYLQIKERRGSVFEERFACAPKTLELYRQYMHAFGAPGGSIEDQIRQHMKLLYSAYGTMHRLGMETPGQRRRNEDIYKYIGPKGMAWEVGKYRLAARAGKWMRVGGSMANSYAQFVKPQEWQLECWDAKAPDGVLQFVAHYIHDSKVDFIFNIGDPFSYFKARGVEESTISVWAEAGNWIEDKATAVANRVNTEVEQGKQVIGKAINDTTAATRRTAESVAQAAREKAEAAKRRAIEAADSARRKLIEVEQAGEAAAARAADAARAAAEAAQERANQAAAHAAELGRRAEAATTTAVNEARAHSKAVASAAERQIMETTESAERLFDSGINWIKRTALGEGDNKRAP